MNVRNNKQKQTDIKSYKKTGFKSQYLANGSYADNRSKPDDAAASY